MQAQRATYVAQIPVKRQETTKSEKSHTNGPASLIELATAKRYQKDRGENRIIEGEDGVKYVQPKVNHVIYFKGLPKDASEGEALDFFSRVGLVKKDPETLKPMLKLYRDEEGQLKGDGLVTYFREQSVPLALTILHETDLRPGHPIHIEEAKFKLEPGAVVKTSRRRRKRKRDQVSEADDPDAPDGDHSENEGDGGDLETAESDKSKGVEGKKNKTGKPNENASIDPSKVVIAKRKKKLYDQSVELSWEEKEQKHVILRNMFRLADAQADPTFYDELKQEVLEESSKFGHVESVKVMEGSPLGIVAIKFSTGAAAERCIATMNGRKFDEVRITAEYYDGFTNYAVAESEESVAKRDAGWAEWLGDGK